MDTKLSEVEEKMIVLRDNIAIKYYQIVEQLLEENVKEAVQEFDNFRLLQNKEKKFTEIKYLGLCNAYRKLSERFDLYIHNVGCLKERISKHNTQSYKHIQIQEVTIKKQGEVINDLRQRLSVALQQNIESASTQDLKKELDESHENIRVLRSKIEFVEGEKQKYMSDYFKQYLITQEIRDYAKQNKVECGETAKEMVKALQKTREERAKYQREREKWSKIYGLAYSAHVKTLHNQPLNEEEEKIFSQWKRLYGGNIDLTAQSNSDEDQPSQVEPKAPVSQSSSSPKRKEPPKIQSKRLRRAKKQKA